MSKIQCNTLIINRSDTRCGNCLRGCDPDELMHDSVYGYNIFPGEVGCGTEFKYLDSDYYGMRESLERRRPDLIWIGSNK